MISVITPTGGRPEALALLDEYIRRQTMECQWIVVDDCPEPAQTSADMTITPSPLWTAGDNTQCRNIAAALPYVRYDKILIMEDDDWYADTYIEVMANMLDDYDLVGEGFARYFNVRNFSYMQHENASHASLCSTGMKGDATSILKALLRENCPWIDVELWRAFNGGKIVFENKGLSVGIKGMPGRAGIGMGHSMIKDIDPQKLQEWIGDDCSKYNEYTRWAEPS